jgi:hypothetical protein
MPAALERCVNHVKAKGHGVSSAFAICRSSMGTNAQILAREKKKKNPLIIHKK